MPRSVIGRLHSELPLFECEQVRGAVGERHLEPRAPMVSLAGPTIVPRPATARPTRRRRSTVSPLTRPAHGAAVGTNRAVTPTSSPRSSTTSARIGSGWTIAGDGAGSRPGQGGSSTSTGPAAFIGTGEPGRSGVTGSPHGTRLACSRRVPSAGERRRLRPVLAEEALDAGDRPADAVRHIAPARPEPGLRTSRRPDVSRDEPDERDPAGQLSTFADPPFELPAHAFGDRCRGECSRVAPRARPFLAVLGLHRDLELRARQAERHQPLRELVRRCLPGEHRDVDAMRGRVELARHGEVGRDRAGLEEASVLARTRGGERSRRRTEARDDTVAGECREIAERPEAETSATELARVRGCREDVDARTARGTMRSRRVRSRAAHRRRATRRTARRRYRCGTCRRCADGWVRIISIESSTASATRVRSSSSPPK